MRALIVYDSAYGNTEQVAQAIGDGLGTKGDVQVVRAGDVRPEQLAGLDLLVVGSPTQRFTSLPSINRFLKSIPSGGLQGVKVAAFDTRITVSEIEKVHILAFLVRIFGYAAEPVLSKLEKKAGEPAVSAEGFFVGGTEGPLNEGELERAASWAQEIARGME